MNFTRLIAAAACAALLAGTAAAPARAHGGLSEASALSMLPLAVSVCTANTARMRCAVSSRSAAATAAASIGKPSCQGVRTTSRPSASATRAHWSAKWPVPGTSTACPGAARF